MQASSYYQVAEGACRRRTRLLERIANTYYCSYDIVVPRYEKYLTFELKLASLRAPAVLKHSRHALKTNLREFMVQRS